MDIENTPSPTESVEVEIAGRTFRLRPWSPDDGDRWFFRIMRAALALMGDHASDNAALLALLTMVDEDTFIALRDVCLKYTDLIGKDEQGRETVILLAKNREPLRGRYDELVALMREHVMARFAGPFLRSAASLAGGGSAKGS